MRQHRGWRIGLGTALFWLGVSAIAHGGQWYWVREASVPRGPDTVSACPVGPLHRCLRPAERPQAGTHFGVQEFPWGYFGASSFASPAAHQNYHADSCQWEFQRAD
jgi:hypothetical protein